MSQSLEDVKMLYKGNRHWAPHTPLQCPRGTVCASYSGKHSKHNSTEVIPVLPGAS